jgi:hypothetical protein
MSRIYPIAHVPLSTSLLAGVALTLLAGCGHRAEIVLLQPDAPPSQQHIEVDSEAAYYAPEGQWQRCMLTFPLPGTHRGPRAFVVYIWAPNTIGESAVNRIDDGGVRGFLIQEIGHRAGRTDFAGGTVTFKKVWLRPQKRKVELDVVCEDGTTIQGAAVVMEAAATLQALEREFAADVAGVTHSDTPHETARRTEARGAQAP